MVCLEFKYTCYDRTEHVFNNNFDYFIYNLVLFIVKNLRTCSLEQYVVDLLNDLDKLKNL